MKDITAKEFWRVLEENKIMTKKITGFKGLLNEMIIDLRLLSKEAAKEGKELTAKMYKEKSDKIQDYLESIGYIRY